MYIKGNGVTQPWYGSPVTDLYLELCQMVKNKNPDFAGKVREYKEHFTYLPEDVMENILNFFKAYGEKNYLQTRLCSNTLGEQEFVSSFVANDDSSTSLAHSLFGDLESCIYLRHIIEGKIRDNYKTFLSQVRCVPYSSKPEEAFLSVPESPIVIKVLSQMSGIHKFGHSSPGINLAEYSEYTEIILAYASRFGFTTGYVRIPEPVPINRERVINVLSPETAEVISFIRKERKMTDVSVSLSVEQQRLYQLRDEESRILIIRGDDMAQAALGRMLRDRGYREDEHVKRWRQVGAYSIGPGRFALSHNDLVALPDDVRNNWIDVYLRYFCKNDEERKRLEDSRNIDLVYWHKDLKPVFAGYSSMKFGEIVTVVQDKVNAFRREFSWAIPYLLEDPGPSLGNRCVYGYLDSYVIGDKTLGTAIRELWPVTRPTDEIDLVYNIRFNRIQELLRAIKIKPGNEAGTEAKRSWRTRAGGKWNKKTHFAETA